MLCWHLASLAELLPEPRQQEHAHNCRQLLLRDSQAFQHVGETLGDLARQEALPKELLCLLLTSLRHLFGEVEGKGDLPEPARRGSLWVSLGLLQIQTWLPQARFDPAVKREYKLKYAKEEVWREGWNVGCILTRWLCLVYYSFHSLWMLRAQGTVHKLPCDIPGVCSVDCDVLSVGSSE